MPKETKRKKTAVASTEEETSQPVSKLISTTYTATEDDSNSSISGSHRQENDVQTKVISASGQQGLATREIIRPKPTYTGSREQPMCLDSSSSSNGNVSDSDDDSSILEVLAPRKEQQGQQQQHQKKMAARLAKTNTGTVKITYISTCD